MRVGACAASARKGLHQKQGPRCRLCLPSALCLWPVQAGVSKLQRFRGRHAQPLCQLQAANRPEGSAAVRSQLALGEVSGTAAGGPCLAC